MGIRDPYARVSPGECMCAYSVQATQRKGQGASERGRHEENRETRTRASLPCSWWCFGIEVEVDERVQLLERERLCSFVVNEHTLPFLRGLLVALEHYHLIILYKNYFPHQLVCVMGVNEGRRGKRVSRTNVDCGSLNPDGGYFLARVHLECAWLGSVYRCGLVIVCNRM